MRFLPGISVALLAIGAALVWSVDPYSPVPLIFAALALVASFALPPVLGRRGGNAPHSAEPGPAVEGTGGPTDTPGPH